MSIRTLDMSLLHCGMKGYEEQFCQDLLSCLSEQGFVKLFHHSIPRDVIDDAFAWNARFFKLPVEVKKKIQHPPHANPNRGWSAIGQEKSSNITDFEKGKEAAADVFDAKEAFDMGAIDDPLYANMWLDDSELPKFREFLESFYAVCHRVHMEILRALEAAFLARGIKVDLVSRCAENVSELRLNYYPPIDVIDIKSGKMNRISSHTDFGTVTLLFQDTVGGLEVENQSMLGTGAHIPVEASSRAEMLVNIGDSLQRLTNNILTSVSHRVTIPVGAKELANGRINERYSIAYFAKVNRNQSLRPLSPFVDEEHPALYPDITAYELNQTKLKKIYGE